MSYVVAIPSYGRVEGLKNNTLKTLHDGGIPSSKIYVFVANKEEETAYREGIPKELYGKLIVGIKGLLEQRNFITDYFPKGQRYVSIDDDVKGYYKVVPPAGEKRSLTGSKLVQIHKLDTLFRLGFEECAKHKYHLWGIAPVANAGFMKNEIDTDIRFISGGTFGVINRKMPLHIAYKDDYERTLQNAVIDGGVIRLSGVCAKWRMYQPGGLDAKRVERIDENRKSAKYLMDKYPGLVFEKKMKDPSLKGTEIRLAKRLGEKEEELEGGKRIHIEGEDDTSISTLPIRNKERYDRLKATLLDVLERSTVPKIPKPAPTAHSNRGTKLGTIGRTITFGYGDTRRGIKEYASNARHPELLKALIDFGNCIVPKGWDYNGITLNHGVKAKKHKDSKNLGVSYIIGIGDFTGGKIKVWDKDDKHPVEMDLHDKPVGFNGGLLFHQTTPFKGNRYTIIYYKQMWEGDIKGHTTKGSGAYEEDEDLEGGIFA
jgi:hypothetical protein